MVIPAHAVERIEPVTAVADEPPRYQPKNLARRAWLYLGVAITVLFVGPALYTAILHDPYRLTLAKLPIVLKSVGMAATSILAANWVAVAAVNLGAAAAWLIVGHKAKTR